MTLHPREEWLLNGANVTVNPVTLALSGKMRVVPITPQTPLGWDSVEGGAKSADDWADPSNRCTLFDSGEAELPHGLMEPHGGMWHFATRTEAQVWSERIDAENVRWGSKPIDLPWFLTMTPVESDELHQAYYDNAPADEQGLTPEDKRG